MIQETKRVTVAALRCPRCTWWTASTQGRHALRRGGPLEGQLVAHLMSAHALEREPAEQEASQVEPR